MIFQRSYLGLAKLVENWWLRMIKICTVWPWLYAPVKYGFTAWVEISFIIFHYYAVLKPSQSSGARDICLAILHSVSFIRSTSFLKVFFHRFSFASYEDFFQSAEILWCSNKWGYVACLCASYFEWGNMGMLYTKVTKWQWQLLTEICRSD